MEEAVRALQQQVNALMSQNASLMHSLKHHESQPESTRAKHVNLRNFSSFFIFHFSIFSYFSFFTFFIFSIFSFFYAAVRFRFAALASGLILPTSLSAILVVVVIQGRERDTSRTKWMSELFFFEVICALAFRVGVL